jgi:hypothetical protein
MLKSIKETLKGKCRLVLPPLICHEPIPHWITGQRYLMLMQKEGNAAMRVRMNMAIALVKKREIFFTR